MNPLSFLFLFILLLLPTGLGPPPPPPLTVLWPLAPDIFREPPARIDIAQPLAGVALLRRVPSVPFRAIRG